MKPVESLLYEDLGLQERNGKMYYISVYKGRELLCDAAEAEASGYIGKFRWEFDSSHMTPKETWELDIWLTQRGPELGRYSEEEIERMNKIMAKKWK